MIEHESFPVDDWTIHETGFNADVIGQSETIFATANGYLGLRGNLEEGEPIFKYGTYINGFHETRPITYGEGAYGYAKDGQTILNVTDGKLIELAVEGEPLDLRTGTVYEHSRTLDMRNGILERHIDWVTPRGIRVLVRSRRFASFVEPHLAVIVYEFEIVDRAARVTLTSSLVGNESNQVNDSDPRAAAELFGRVLRPITWSAEGRRLIMCHNTDRSKMKVAAGMDHVFETINPTEEAVDHSPDKGRLVFTIDLEANTPFRMVKYLAYHHGAEADDADGLVDATGATLDTGIRRGAADMQGAQKDYVADFWSKSDVAIEGDPALQQAIRFSLFQILQASAAIENTSIPAKGLTGQGYEGHYFWDTEIFVLPFLTYSTPETALRVLEYRHSILDTARARAHTMSQKGALYPWRTINGHEASAFFPAGTAAYHIDADVAYALRRYVRATGNKDFLYGTGAEILVETARLWADLGYHNPERDDAFCINQVTGPDEYSALVNNNLYTNMLARENLEYAAEVVEEIRSTDSHAFARLIERTGLEDGDVEAWKRAADAMYIGFDKERGIHRKDDSFLDKEVWDIANTPKENFPLLLHYHPLVIYRFQVIKQADLVLAMQLCEPRFTAEEKRANFDYYTTVTVDDSSLSAGSQAVVAADIGETDRALEFLRRTARMDLDDVEANVRDGIHIAASGGTWVAIMYSFGGLRDQTGELGFKPRLPKDWKRLRFKTAWNGARVAVDIGTDTVAYTLVEGDKFTFTHWDEPIGLRTGETRKMPIPER